MTGNLRETMGGPNNYTAEQRQVLSWYTVDNLVVGTDDADRLKETVRLAQQFDLAVQDVPGQMRGIDLSPLAEQFEHAVRFVDQASGGAPSVLKAYEFSDALTKLYPEAQGIYSKTAGATNIVLNLEGKNIALNFYFYG